MIKGLFADIFISVYLLSTLLIRFLIEPTLAQHPLLSLAFGFVLILFLLALIKVNVLAPNYFGLLQKKESKISIVTEEEPHSNTMFI